MDEQGKQMNEQTAHGTSVMVSHGRQNTQTIDVFSQNKTKELILAADKIATSSMIPEHYQRRPDNVLVAMYRSTRLGVDLFSYMEKTYMVHGKVGHEATFTISMINKSGLFETPLLYEMSGEIHRDEKNHVLPTSTRKCKAWAVLKSVKKEVSQEVDIKMAFLEGWMKNQKWHTMTDVMLQYRAASFFGKMYCPEVTMGLNTREELEDISDAEVIEETDQGRDIFENGTEIDTKPEEVLDPALEVKQNSGSPETLPEKTVVAEKVKPVTTPPDTSLDDNPPVDPVEFKKWFLSRFATELHELDVFLLSKKWLTMGQTAEDLTDSKLKNLRTQWDRFTKAYESFKKARHS